MAHFAKIDDNGIVLTVVVIADSDTADSDGNEVEAIGVAFCKSLFGADTNWVQTSYNDNLRCRYAGKGMKYDSDNDVFYKLSDYPSWVLNTSTWEWEPPIDKPDDAGPLGGSRDFPAQHVDYTWDEDTISWVNRTVIDLNYDYE